MSESEPKFDLGERIQVAPSAGTLPHPQGGDPWSNADAPSVPFTQQAPAPAQTSAARQVSYDPAAAKAQQPQQAAAAPVATGKRPVPPSSQVSRKETKLLRKFREVFGIRRVESVEAVVERRDPHDPSLNVEMRFGLRAMNYEDYQWVLEKASELNQNPRLAMFSFRAAVVSMGVCSLDGVPIWEVLGFEPENPDDVRDPLYPKMGLRFQAAQAWCDELTVSLYDTIDAIYSQYEKKVDTQYLPEAAEPADAPEEAPAAPLPPSGSSS